MKNSGIQLNRYIAQAGICSRRKAEELVGSGRVTVNNSIETRPGYRVKPGDVVEVNGKYIEPEEKIYLLLNKPNDYITTRSDDRGRKTVMELVKDATKKQIHPIGRLDRKTTGVLLFTNDGDFTQKLAHPKYGVQKVYHVTLDHKLQQKDLQTIQRGVELDDGLVEVDSVAFVPRSRKQLIVTIHSGKYRVIRRLFKALDYEVITLDRIAYAGLTTEGLRLGQWRFLNKQEVAALKK